MEKTIVLSEDAPVQNENHPHGQAYRKGDLATLFDRDGEFFFTIHGIGEGGNYYEMDDVGGFASMEEAESKARQFYEDSHALNR